MSINSGWAVPGLKNRFLMISLAAVGIFLLLLCRLWYLQIINTERYSELSEKNRIRYLPISAARGPIFDRDGKLLVDTRPSFDVAIMRQDMEDKDLLLERLAYYLDADPETLGRNWKAGVGFPAYRPVPLAEDVGRDAMERIQENSVDLPGVLTEVRSIRAYPYADFAAHIFGYLGEITERELQTRGGEGYRGGDFVGKSGVENLLESYLRGSEGQRRLEVDVKGKELRQLIVREPMPGNRVYLSLRHDLQLAAETAFGDQAGSAVVLDVRTGEILALVSRPAFNPELFARGITGPEWIALLQDPRHPLQDKAIKGQYPPGSTFKIVTALAALEAGVVTPSTTYDCDGSMTLGDSKFRCWKKRGHGRTDLEKALRESCDVWFYKAGLETGIDRLSEMAFALGLGAPTGFPLDGEKDGLIPTKQWKRKRFGAPWYNGETVIAAIGQGYVLATPLQLAVMTAAVANGGTVLQPTLIKRVEDWQGKELLPSERVISNTVQLRPGNLAAVRRGLEAVVNAPHGTGWASQLDGVKVAGKTGTAQVVRLKSDEEKEKERDEKEEPYRFRDHALFVAYAPAAAPEIAVAVVVEHGEHGGSAAAPIARNILETYFGLGTQTPVGEPADAGD